MPRTVGVSGAIFLSKSPVGILLQALSAAPSAITVNTALNGVISGATAGSTMVLSGPGSAGLSLSGTGTTRTLSGTPTTVGIVTITETYPGALNSPNPSTAIVTVVANLMTDIDNSALLDVDTTSLLDAA